jgi:hypothetical protein
MVDCGDGLPAKKLTWASRRVYPGAMPVKGHRMDMTNLSAMNMKQLEALFANTLPGSINHDLIKPVLEAKRREADSRRT